VWKRRLRICWRILKGACLLRAYASLVRCWIVFSVAELDVLLPIALLGVVLISPRTPMLLKPFLKLVLVIILPLANIIIVVPAPSPRIIAVTDVIFLFWLYKYRFDLVYNSSLEACSEALGRESNVRPIWDPSLCLYQTRCLTPYSFCLTAFSGCTALERIVDIPLKGSRENEWSAGAECLPSP
jgi:hypothetical protein